MVVQNNVPGKRVTGPVELVRELDQELPEIIAGPMQLRQVS